MSLRLSHLYQALSLDKSVLCMLCRGDSFRMEFSHLGEIRSIVPRGVHLMALTAMLYCQQESTYRISLISPHADSQLNYARS